MCARTLRDLSMLAAVYKQTERAAADVVRSRAARAGPSYLDDTDEEVAEVQVPEDLDHDLLVQELQRGRQDPDCEE